MPAKEIRLPIAVMPQPRNYLGIAIRVGLVAFSLLLAIGTPASVAQERNSEYDSPAATDASPQFAFNNIVAATLCFAVGFGACLLVVYYLLPSLVYSQCVEIVREYMHHTKSESDIRVVVLDRESHEPLQRPRRASVAAEGTIEEPSYETQSYLRLDKPTSPTCTAQAASADSHSIEAPNSMLSQIYEQNLHLRDQLRQQSRSVKQ